MDINFDYKSLFTRSQSTSNSTFFHSNKYSTPDNSQSELSNKKSSPQMTELNHMLHVLTPKPTLSNKKK